MHGKNADMMVCNKACPLLDGLCFGVPGIPSSPGWTQGFDLCDQIAPRIPVGTDPFLVPRVRRDAISAWASGKVMAAPMGFQAFTEAFCGVLSQLGEGGCCRYVRFQQLDALWPPWQNF